MSTDQLKCVDTPARMGEGVHNSSSSTCHVGPSSALIFTSSLLPPADTNMMIHLSI